MNEELAARKSDLAGIQDQLGKARAEVAEQANVEKQLATARDQLKQISDQKATEQRALADASDQVAAHNRDLSDMENRLAQEREALKQTTAQRADIEKAVVELDRPAGPAGGRCREGPERGGRSPEAACAAGRPGSPAQP